MLLSALGPGVVLWLPDWQLQGSVSYSWMQEMIKAMPPSSKSLLYSFNPPNMSL